MVLGHREVCWGLLPQSLLRLGVDRGGLEQGALWGEGFVDGKVANSWGASGTHFPGSWG